MSRVALTKQIKLLLVAAIVLIVAAGGVAAYVMTSNHTVQTTTNAQHQLTEISYRGENGIDALTLLKRHAQVEVKHYSFGDLVMAINGSAGSGSKYWTFYVNGKPADVGAGSYITKNSDTLSWKLQ